MSRWLLEGAAANYAKMRNLRHFLVKVSPSRKGFRTSKTSNSADWLNFVWYEAPKMYVEVLFGVHMPWKSQIIFLRRVKK